VGPVAHHGSSRLGILSGTVHPFNPRANGLLPRKMAEKNGAEWCATRSFNGAKKIHGGSGFAGK